MSDSNASPASPTDPPSSQLPATQAFAPDEVAARLATLLDQYLEQLQQGRPLDRRQFLDAHPELASQLEQCLAGIEFVHQVRVGGEPTQLGDFRIVREIGRGGMGVVYEAEQISLKRRVALKVLRFGAVADAEAMQRFQREAETVATLHHTNIVPIFAIGREQAVNYYAMQFIEGESLAHCAPSVSLDSHSAPSAIRDFETTLRVSRWGLQAAEALAHAHQRGVIHRDIKPSNLILDPDGRIWLTDFGLAKRMDDVSLSMAGAILGTPRYMSPEQAAAARQPVDHRTDIYSLGATLYELATGRPLFDGDSLHSVITQILTSEPTTPRAICPTLARDFETIILKCLSKDPGRRYPTAQALADDLRAFGDGRAIKARRATWAEQAARWFKQQKRSVGVAAATVAATVILVACGLIAWQMRLQARLGYLTLNTPREVDQRADVAEVLSLQDELVGAPFTLPTKEPLALPEGAYRLRLTGPSKLSRDYLFDVAAGEAATFDVGLTMEAVGHAIPLRSPAGVEIVSTPGPKAAEPRLYVGPQNPAKPTMRCYSVASQPQQRVVQEGASHNVAWDTEPQPFFEADWSLESPEIVSFLNLPADRETWKVMPAQADVSAWRQVVSWFGGFWFRKGERPTVLKPSRDLNSDGIEDVIWSAPRLANPQQGVFVPGPSSPKPAMLVAASGKDGKPLWWFRPQDSNGSAARLMTAAVWANDDAIVIALHSENGPETWLEAVSMTSGASLWRAPVPDTAGTIHPSLLNSAVVESVNPVIVAAVGRRLMAVDVATGKPLWEPLDLGETLQDPPHIADLDGDERPEVLFVSMEQGQPPQCTALSLADRKPLWTAPVGLDSNAFNQRDPQPTWPGIVDFNGDGRAEVILPNGGGRTPENWMGVQVLDGSTGKRLWSRRFPQLFGGWTNIHTATERYAAGPDLNGDGSRELFMISVRCELQTQAANLNLVYHRQHYCVYVDCFSGRDGQSVWWQRIPLGVSEYSTWAGDPEAPLWWEGDEHGWPKLVLPVRRHADQGGDGIDNAGARLLFVLSAETGRVLHTAEHLALPALVDWNADGLDDLAVFVPDDPVKFADLDVYSEEPGGQFVVLRGAPPEAFRRLERWSDEQDFDGDGFADLSRPVGGMGLDYAVQIASGRDGLLASHWKVDWPETPHTFAVGGLQTFAPPRGDFDGDGLADLLLRRDCWLRDFDGTPFPRNGKAPLLVQTISGKTGKRLWGGPDWELPDAFRPPAGDEEVIPNHYLQLTTTLAVDLDRDSRPELLQVFQLTGSRRDLAGAASEQRQQFLASIDGRSGTLRWSEPFTEPQASDGSGQNLSEYIQVDASSDLNADGTLDLVLFTPRQTPSGSWTADLQARNGRDGKRLWGPVAPYGGWFNNNGARLPMIGDLDDDGRPELVVLESKDPLVVHALRGGTGETLWKWKGALPPNFAEPGVVLIGDKKSRFVAVTNNETGNQWELVLLDAKGQVAERVPYESNQIWSHDLDGDGGEELLRFVERKITASRGLNEVIWTWPPPLGYVYVSGFDRTEDGRAIVVTISGDSLTLLDGSTGKPLGRTWKSTNTSLYENNRLLDLNHARLATPPENTRLLTRVGDGPRAINHVVSRAVLPTDDVGRYTDRELSRRKDAPLPSASGDDDPRLVRQLMWAPTPAEWATSGGQVFKDVLLAAGLSLVVVLTPYSMIRAGLRRRELRRGRIALIGGGIVLLLVCVTLLQFPPLGSRWRDVPWALPLAIAFGGLPILLYPATMFRALANGNWRRLRGLLLATLILSLVLAAILMTIDISRKPPEQHYSWYGWWIIFLMGAWFTGALLVLGHVFRPVGDWLRRRLRARLPRHA